MMTARGHEKAGPFQIEKNRGDHRHVGQMRASVIRIVQHIDVAAPHRGVALHDRSNGFAHGSQVHRHVGRIGDQRALAVEHRAAEIQAFLDVHRMSRVLQPQAHLFGDVHEQIVEDLEQHRIDACTGIPGSGQPMNSAQFQIPFGRGLRTPSRFDHGRGIALDDDRGAVDAGARGEGIA